MENPPKVNIIRYHKILNEMKWDREVYGFMVNCLYMISLQFIWVNIRKK